MAASRLGLAEADTEDGQRSDSLQARLFHLDREQLTVQVRYIVTIAGTKIFGRNWLCPIGFDLDRTLIFFLNTLNTKLLIFCSKKGWKLKENASF